MPYLARLTLLCFALGFACDAAAGAPRRNGFVLDPDRIDVSEIESGGPGRDGIPALLSPRHDPAGAAAWSDAEPVVGVALDGEARAYPLALLVWHELVNDRLGEQPILISYCPLCGTAMVFERRIAGSVRTFGVSGLLYRSDLLLYDHQTESLWSQISAEAVTGPSQGLRLVLLRARVMPWGSWRRAHPETTVLSRETGYRRDYGRAPYGDYAQSDQLLFPVRLDRRYHPKTPTLGVRLPGGAARAYPAAELESAGGSVEEEFEGRRVRVAYDPKERVFEVRAPKEVEVVEGYWFAWAAFHPETSVFVAEESAGP